MCVLNVSAQDDAPDKFEIQAVIDACIALRDAAESGDIEDLRMSAKKLRTVGSSDFSLLVCEDDSISSLNGHLVFDEVFAESLASGKMSVYNQADSINRDKKNRGQTADGSYKTKTCFVKAGKSSKYTFSTKGYQELAVVAEAGGLVTMKIHVTNSAGLDCRFDDTKHVKTGLPQRQVSFTLPTNRRNVVELDIINCGNKDCSFVIISN